MRVVVGSLIILALSCHRAPLPAGGPRIVSLSPSITETLFALGVGEQVVGVTDYCDFPAEAKTRTRTGSLLQPNYEVIAGLRPTLILGEQIRNSPEDRLKVIAPTHVLPWLSLPEVVSSIRELGRLVDRQPAANQLAEQIQARLQATPQPKAPRVLLVVAGPPGPLSEIWYIKRNSLHGRVLEASGGRNAIDEDVSGAPVLSLEKLITVDPDIVLILLATDQVADSVRQQYIDAWRDLPLEAVMNDAVQVLAGTEVQATGPRILKMADRLTAALHELEPKP